MSCYLHGFVSAPLNIVKEQPLHLTAVDIAEEIRQYESYCPHMHVFQGAGGTRTCIHTPGQAYDPSELHDPGLILEGAKLAYFDGRLTEAAVQLACTAREAGVPVLVEAERLRPGLDLLLGNADYVVTSAHFPKVRVSFMARKQ